VISDAAKLTVAKGSSGKSPPFAAFDAEQIESTGALRVERGLRTEWSVQY
jgi:hypothetical protein